MKKIFGLLILNYLRILAKIQLKKIKPDIIGFTGSVGKSSLGAAIFAILSKKYKCRQSEGFNSESGIPLNILGLKMKNYSVFDWLRVCILAPLTLIFNWRKYEKYIVEMGVDSPDAPKNMGYLLKIVRPRIGVFLNVSPVHTEFFEKKITAPITSRKETEKSVLDLIAQEKGKLIESLPANGFAILNIDDKRVAEFTPRTKANVLKFALQNKAGADLYAQNIKSGLAGFEMEIFHHHTAQKLKLNFPLPEDYAATILAAIVVGFALNFNLKDCAQELEKNFKLPPGRFSLIPGIKNTIIIDSSYNASGMPMLAALNFLASINGRKKIAVLGDMRELGKEAESQHQAVAERAVKSADLLILVGPLMKKYFLPHALKLGFDKANIFWFNSSKEAGIFLRETIKNGEIILFKGSQNNIFLESAIEEIMVEPERKKELLCRQSKYWEKIRNRYWVN